MWMFSSGLCVWLLLQCNLAFHSSDCASYNWYTFFSQVCVCDIDHGADTTRHNQVLVASAAVPFTSAPTRKYLYWASHSNTLIQDCESLRPP